MGQCSIKDCPNPSRARGWCQKHYQRWYKWGDPNYTAQTSYAGMTLKEQFWNRVVKGSNLNDCWVWKGSTHDSGYGRLYGPKGTESAAHRYSYIIHFGEIPAGLFVCHECDNPPCSNPSHLFVGTAKDNSDDMMIKGRGNKPKKWLYCSKGHEISGANLYRYPDGRERCRICLGKYRDIPRPECSIEGCTNQILARGWCSKHYGRWYKNGSPLLVRNRWSKDPVEKG